MSISKYALWSDLNFLNTEGYSLKKDEKKYYLFIEALDEKFKLYMDQHPGESGVGTGSEHRRVQILQRPGCRQGL